MLVLALPSLAADGAIPRLTGADALVRATARPVPKYPRVAQSGHIEGPVKLRLKVSANGTVSETQALTGIPVLLIAALDATKGWRFRGDSAFETEITFVFSLSNGISIVGSAR